MADDVVAEPGRDLAAVAGACKALISQDDCAEIMPMANDSSHSLIDSPAKAP